MVDNSPCRHRSVPHGLVRLSGYFCFPRCCSRQSRNPRNDRCGLRFPETSTVAATDVRKELAVTCPNLQLTTDPLRSDYALEAMAGTVNVVFPAEVTRYRFTLFDRSGNAFFSTAPHKFSKGIHNVCMAIDSKSEGRDAQVGDDEPSVESTGPTLD